MDIRTLIAEMNTNGAFTTIARTPLAQFGVPARQYLGATLLPEREVPENAYREEAVRYRTIIANDGTRYSATQKKKGELVGSVLVELGNSDIKRELTAREYDALLSMAVGNNSMEATARIIRWSDTVLNRALLEKNELQRWQAIVGASVTRQGDNNYTETVIYSNPTGHRFNAASIWSNDANDPFVDIFNAADLLRAKGFTVNRIITSSNVVAILAKNAKVRAAVGQITYGPNGSIGRAFTQSINNVLGANNLPPIEQYDLQYRTSTGSGYFLARNVFVLVATTGRDENIDLGDSQKLLPDTVGYLAVGRPAGQANPGRVIRVEAFDNKPPRLEGEAWQTSLPVITEPESHVVIGAIS